MYLLEIINKKSILGWMPTSKKNEDVRHGGVLNCGKIYQKLIKEKPGPAGSEVERLLHKIVSSGDPSLNPAK